MHCTSVKLIFNLISLHEIHWHSSLTGFSSTQYPWFYRCDWVVYGSSDNYSSRRIKPLRQLRGEKHQTLIDWWKGSDSSNTRNFSFWASIQIIIIILVIVFAISVVEAWYKSDVIWTFLTWEILCLQVSIKFLRSFLARWYICARNNKLGTFCA